MKIVGVNKPKECPKRFERWFYIGTDRIKYMTFCLVKSAKDVKY